MTKQPVVQLENISKVIGNKTIIDQLSFELYPGEVVGFLGPNGAGKTTTIRMIVGLMAPTSGKILIEGIDIDQEFEKAIRHVGAIVENPELYKYMSGYNNLVHYARMVDGVTDERIEEVIELVGLQNRIEQKVKTYSLGMRQRLGLAQALLHKPRLLILDEPTNGLDPAGIREFRDYLRYVADQEGVCVLVSSHLLSEIELMCDRTLIIQSGKLIGEKQIQVKQEKSQGQKIVRFEVSPVDKAVSLLSSTYQAVSDGFEVEMGREAVAALVQKLVAENIQIYAIETRVKSLEDEFLEITGGKSVD
ncbi:ABC transporter ATP-binding protein [Shimazuella sp. AN120528]|uniref:ABC transporter ATP-binding protein n=1 Tax=Shimazuella soli TaxID=1892854 RepID=UPI001F0D2062|nr:ABC transporter ATP-binding protein [Shimazuella soli]MCH5584660.1 ABC transporter ATP-binding protein [Shimazuella soli]